MKLRTMGLFVRDESGGMWEETVTTNFKYCSGIYLEGLNKNWLIFKLGTP
jgi:hypothetical protein